MVAGNPLQPAKGTPALVRRQDRTRDFVRAQWRRGTSAILPVTNVGKRIKVHAGLKTVHVGGGDMSCVSSLLIDGAAGVERSIHWPRWKRWCWRESFVIEGIEPLVLEMGDKSTDTASKILRGPQGLELHSVTSILHLVLLQVRSVLMLDNGWRGVPVHSLEVAKRMSAILVLLCCDAGRRGRPRAVVKPWHGLIAEIIGVYVEARCPRPLR